MPSEKPTQDIYIKTLDAKGIEYIHIGNRMFGKYRTPHCLKYLPDLLFLFNGTLYLRELGVPGRHLERKSKQMDKMKRWAAHGADIAIITSIEAALEDLKNIGVTE